MSNFSSSLYILKIIEYSFFKNLLPSFLLCPIYADPCIYTNKLAAMDSFKTSINKVRACLEPLRCLHYDRIKGILDTQF